jgi:hypothetical protein
LQSKSHEPLPFTDIDYSKNKRVSCIAFHPTRHHIVALSFVENLEFDMRAEISGKSYESSVLVLNFADPTMITLQMVLRSPIEIERIAWHPEKPDVLFGGAISGQLTFWDFSDETTRIVEIEQSKGEGEEESAPMPEEGDESEEADATQVARKFKSVMFSSIRNSHKNCVADLQWVPKKVKFYRPNPALEDVFTHLASCGEDG